MKSTTEHYKTFSVTTYHLSDQEKKALTVSKDAFDWCFTHPSQRTLWMKIKRFKAKLMKCVQNG